MSSKLITQLFGPDSIPVSRIALGCMGLAGTWNPAEVGPEHRRKAIATVEAALDAGINFFDHADIYGGGACEAIFKDCLAAVTYKREKIIIATKAAIRQGYYDHSPSYLKQSLQASLDRLGIDYVDVYQLHRPDPLSHPAQTAQVLDEMVAQGLIKYVGVSNYYPQQVAALRQYMQAPIVSNQISLSLLRLDPVYEGAAGGPGSVAPVGDGVLDQCLQFGITPLAYSPLGNGWLAGRRDIPADHPRHVAIEATLAVLRELSPAYGDATAAQLSLAWLLAHPAGIIPLVGSNNPAHVREAVVAQALRLSRVDWYKLWVAARGERVP